MWNRSMYMAFLTVCALGMAACTGGKQDGAAGQEIQGQMAADGRQEAREEDGQGTSAKEDGEEGRAEGLGESMAENPAGSQAGDSAGSREGEPGNPAGSQPGDSAGGREGGSGNPEGSQAGDSAGGREGSTGGSESESRLGETAEGSVGSGAESQKENKDGNIAGNGGTEDSSDVDGNLYVYKDEATEEYKAEDGTVLLTVEKVLPVVVISDKEQAAEEINAYIREKGAFGTESILLDMSEEDALEMAGMEYEGWRKDNWVAEYTLSVGYYLARMDDCVVSFKMMGYYYLGGAHPNTCEIGLTFDTQTGKRLMLADVVEDEEAASAAVMDFLLEETKKEEYGDIFFPDYEKYLGGLFADSTWYLGEDGFHIIANTYAIAPYVAGDFDFAIPYGQADFLKEKYR